jgi:magnesium-transporting ATPase (P-type)
MLSSLVSTVQAKLLWSTSCLFRSSFFSLPFPIGAYALRQEADVVCSQPGALLTASQIDTVVFDKTGTLTADTQSLSRVITYPEKKERKRTDKSSAKRPSEAAKEAKDMKVQAAPSKTHRESVNVVLAGCHSLVHLADCNAAANGPIESASMVGDPLELAALRFSGWLYDTDGDYYYPTKTDAAHPKDVEKLWQLRVFPFNPSARLSSALCLTRHSNGEYKLLVVIKGAPEAVLSLLDLESNGGQSFSAWYVRRVQQLEERGYRALAMATKELSFPLDALPTLPASDILRKARQFSETIHRRDLETCGSSTFCGLACFHAQIRPSSKRIVEELELGNIRTIMLTGDSLSAALAVARKVGIVRENAEVAALELDLSSDTGSGDTELQWRTHLARKSKGEEEITKVTTASVDEMLQRMRRGELQLVASGNALSALLSIQGRNGSYAGLAENMHCFSVVARASPECKEKFVASLKGRRVLMSGDGVNDVSAMKEAEVSVALLNGFGSESEGSNHTGRDTEDDRRQQRLKDKSKSESRRSAVPFHAEGIGASKAAANARIKARIEKAQLEITMRALQRQSVDGAASPELQYSLGDIKDMLLSVWSAGLEERRRAVKLQQGGSEAASILAGEDEILRKGSVDGGNSTQPNVEIRPGEACMASPFSCLRSSIDGVEAV